MTEFETWALFELLEATVEENLDRHLAAAEDWLPHEYVPWGEGRNFAALGGEPWSTEQSRLSPVARTALELNLLTEDNLPSYHRELVHTFGFDGAWGAWVNRCLPGSLRGLRRIGIPRSPVPPATPDSGTR